MGYVMAVGFVNLTSLRLRGKGCTNRDNYVPWHAHWGDCMTHSLPSLQQLTAPAHGGTRCAMSRTVQHSMHGAIQEHQALSTQRIGVAVQRKVL